MEHPVRFATSDDGVKIASWTQGAGPPLLLATLPGGFWPPSTLVDNPGTRRLYDNLSQRHTVIAYDARGTGLSQRSVSDFGVQAVSNDLRAVADLYELGDFALLGFRGTTKSAVHFAATNPERISRVVLRDPVLARSDQVLRPRERALQGMIESDFDFYVDAMSLSLAGWETGRQLADAARHATSREVFLEAQSTARGEDVWELVPKVGCPALVVHTKSSEASFPIDIARRVAAAMPLATLTVIQGGPIYGGQDADEFASVTLDFLSDTPTRRSDRAGAGSSTSIILFADIVDSTPLTERMGDVAFRAASAALDTALRRIIAEAGGTAIDGKLLGDGVLATFPAASQAIDAALRCASAGDEGGLPLHLGLHAGDVIREQNNVFGGAVNIASRISGLSAPGEVLVSDVVRALARTSASVTFEDRGEQVLKGVSEPQRVYAVRRLRVG